MRPNILNLEPYSTARDEYSIGGPGIFLDANESPYPNGLNRYPDPHQRKLKERIAAIKGLSPDCIFLGNGSDEAIDLVYRVFCTPGRDNVVAIAPSYGMYAVAAATNDIEMRKVQLGEGWTLPSEKLLAAADARTKAIFICSPNNPTGNAFPVEELLGIVTAFEGIVVVDEAYIDFSGIPSLIGHLGDCPNLIILQTFSKAWGMAGIRLGMAFASRRIIELMSMVKYPYNINCLTQNEVLRHLETGEPDVSGIISEREMLAQALPEKPFVLKVWPSDANFLLAEVTDANGLYAHLISDGIIVRNRSGVKGCEGCLRFTVGTKEENKKLLESLERYEKSNIR